MMTLTPLFFEATALDTVLDAVLDGLAALLMVGALALLVG